MLKEQNIHIDPKKKAKDLTTEDWAALVKVFGEWPFKPEVSPHRFLIVISPTPFALPVQCSATRGRKLHNIRDSLILIMV